VVSTALSLVQDDGLYLPSSFELRVLSAIEEAGECMYVRQCSVLCTSLLEGSCIPIPSSAYSMVSSPYMLSPMVIIFFSNLNGLQKLCISLKVGRGQQFVARSLKSNRGVPLNFERRSISKHDEMYSFMLDMLMPVCLFFFAAFSRSLSM